MSLQYISDSQGKTTGVFIPIQEWNELKDKYKGIEEEHIDIPEQHKEIVRERMKEYKKNPDIALDFDQAMDDIEKSL